MFQNHLDLEHWVLPGKRASQPHPPAEDDKWLLKKRSRAQVTLAYNYCVLPLYSLLIVSVTLYCFLCVGVLSPTQYV